MQSKNKCKIIGVKGQSGSGKDTVGNYLQMKYVFQKMALADPLKEIVSIITGWSMNMIKGETSESRHFRETEIHTDFGMTCREILQHIGTDLFRDHFDPETWVKLARRRVIQSECDIVVTDIRFDNEAQMILDLGGQVWNIERDFDKDSSQVLISETASQHKSEKRFEIAGEKTIKNNGTLQELYAKIDQLLD